MDSACFGRFGRSCPSVPCVHKDECAACVSEEPFILLPQDQSTELAETPGSRFAADCGTLIAEGQLPELLSRLLAQSDLLFRKAADKGQQLMHVEAFVAKPRAPCRVAVPNSVSLPQCRPGVLHQRRLPPGGAVAAPGTSGSSSAGCAVHHSEGGCCAFCSNFCRCTVPEGCLRRHRKARKRVCPRPCLCGTRMPQHQLTACICGRAGRQPAGGPAAGAIGAVQCAARPTAAVQRAAGAPAVSVQKNDHLKLHAGAALVTCTDMDMDMAQLLWPACNAAQSAMTTMSSGQHY